MTGTTEIPIWLALLLVLAATATLYRHLILPLVKSYLAARERNLNAHLQTNLSRKLPEVLRIGRHTRIEMFVNSAEVQSAIEDAVSQGQGTREVLEFKVWEYAKELTPGFHSLFYFKIGFVLARAYIRLLYDLQISKQPPPEIANIPENKSIVLVGNHRSNLDVMILAYLASQTNMVSFAAGEWGKAWPMSAMLHLSGSYIVRRDESLPLYRKILAIHLRNLVKVKMPQGIFLEGKLTPDGSIQSVKLGLLNYLLSALDENNVEDIVFIPVAFNYDQIPEDKNLIESQDRIYTNQSKFITLLSTFRSLLKVIYKRISRGKTAYGRAAVSFGEPISMNSWLAEKRLARPISAEDKKQIVSPVADEIIAKISAMIPVLPISIVASVFKNTQHFPLSHENILSKGRALINQLNTSPAVLAIDKSNVESEIQAGLQMLINRKVITLTTTGYAICSGAEPLLDYLHNSTKHLLTEEHLS